MSKPQGIDDQSVLQSAVIETVGESDGTYTCSSLSCNGETNYTLAVGERAVVFLVLSAPRYRSQNYTVQRVYCSECKASAKRMIGASTSNEAVVEATLTRCTADEPPEVRTAQVVTTSPLNPNSL